MAYRRIMIRVCLAGITGWTAAALVPAIDADADMTLTAGVSRSAAGQRLEEFGVTGDGLVHSSVADALAVAPVDVLVDFTSAAAVKQNARSALDAGVHVVVGSSGLTPEDFEEFDALARTRQVGLFVAGNFSIMAAVLARSAEMAAEHLDHWEILDYASADKPDVPSGTSRELAEALAEVRTPEPAVPVEQLQGPIEARGAEVAGARIHSIRLPSFVVSTEIIFGGAGERLIMRHDPGSSPQPYVAGTLLAIRTVADVPGLRRGLGTLLFDVASGDQ